MNRFKDFTQEEQRMLAEALWKKQRSFIAGDRMFRLYEKLLNEVLQDFNYVPGRVL